MKRTLSVPLLSALFCFADTAQAQEITQEKRGGVKRYVVSDTVLFRREVVDLLQQDKETRKMIRGVRALNFVSIVIGGAGGYLFGYELGTTVAGGQADSRRIVAGGALIGGAVALSTMASTHFDQTIDVYNANRREEMESDSNDVTE